MFVKCNTHIPLFPAQKILCCCCWGVLSRVGIPYHGRSYKLGLAGSAWLTETRLLQLHVFAPTLPFINIFVSTEKQIERVCTFLLLLESCFRSCLLWQSLIKFSVSAYVFPIPVRFSLLALSTSANSSSPSLLLLSLGIYS